jgi:hypothetical protein
MQHGNCSPARKRSRQADRCSLGGVLAFGLDAGDHQPLATALKGNLSRQSSHTYCVIPVNVRMKALAIAGVVHLSGEACDNGRDSQLCYGVLSTYYLNS